MPSSLIKRHRRRRHRRRRPSRRHFLFAPPAATTTTMTTSLTDFAAAAVTTKSSSGCHRLNRAGQSERAVYGMAALNEVVILLQAHASVPLTPPVPPHPALSSPNHPADPYVAPYKSVNDGAVKF